MKHFLNKKIINNSTKGFTLVEFIVIMSIFAIMVGVSLFNFAGFRSTVTMENLAHDIALSIRQIQVSSGATQSSVREIDSEIPRGIMFTKGVGNGFEKQFILFQDNDGDNFYTEGSNELLDQVIIQTKDFISDICFTNNLDDSSGCTSINDPQAVILFQRYATEAVFKVASSSDAEQAGYWIIKIQSGDSDKTREVIVSRIGQVSVR